MGRKDSQVALSVRKDIGKRVSVCPNGPGPPSIPLGLNPCGVLLRISSMSSVSTRGRGASDSPKKRRIRRWKTPGPSTSIGYCPYPIDTDPAHFGLTTGFISTRFGTVVVRHGRRTTAGTATILLHGGAGSWTTWTPLIRAAEQRAASHSAADSPEYSAFTDLVIPDLPGWGDTALPPNKEFLTLDALANTVAEIARSLGYTRWIVLGHSLGGSVALQLASAEVGATTFVGLVSASTFAVIDSVRHPVTRFVGLPAYITLLQMTRALSLFERAGRRFVRDIARMSLLRPVVAPLFRHPLLIDASVLDTLASGVRPRAFAIASEHAHTFDAHRAWSRIECPVRATPGDSDVFVAATDDERLRVVIRDFHVQTIPGTGHFGHVERPYETLSALLGRPRLQHARQ